MKLNEAIEIMKTEMRAAIVNEDGTLVFKRRGYIDKPINANLSVDALKLLHRVCNLARLAK